MQRQGQSWTGQACRPQGQGRRAGRRDGAGRGRRAGRRDRAGQGRRAGRRDRAGHCGQGRRAETGTGLDRAGVQRQGQGWRAGQHMDTAAHSGQAALEEEEGGDTRTGLDLSFAGSHGEYNCMWRCPRPGLNPSGLVNNSSLAAGPQFTEVKIL